jgi:tetratricopeptide (TPR) repeat protein
MKHTRKKRILIGGVIVCILATLGIVFYRPFMAWVGPKSSSDSSQKITKTPQMIAVERIDKAQALIAKGDKQGAVAVYNSAIQATTDASQKQSLLLTKVGICNEAGFYDQAVEAALAADKIKSTATTLGYLARTYDAKGDKSNAITYYTKAIAAINTDSAQKHSSSALVSYQERLSSLQGKH